MTVYLVGAGPGDPGLLTVRGADVLARADVVVYDRLAEPSLLDLAPAGAERVDVGKSPGGPVDQEAINALLVERGLAGREVVRLKGGDPFVFGRGGEEALALLAAGVDFEVVPGVTSAVAAPAYAGVPLTHRGLSTSFTVVTGHSRQQPDVDTDWEGLARCGGTIVVFMGVAHRSRIAERLMAGGRAANTPVMAVHWGTRPNQRSVRTTLAELGAVPLDPPAVIVVGEVAGLDLAWFERRPLFGRRVVVTRAGDQASALAQRLRAQGAETLEIPTIAVVDPADGGAALGRAATGLAGFDWVVFTSVNAVERMLALVRDGRDFGSARLAAIGPSTAEALARRCLIADLVPERAVAESLLDALLAAGPASARALLPRAATAREYLPDGLRAAGWEVEVVPAYRTEAAPLSTAAAQEAGDADAICFTSASTVDGWVAAAGVDATPPVVACIGPVTAEAAARHGLVVTAVATTHTLDGLVAALVDALPPAPTLG
ncbi:MAG: uroporphyrinogen-III C-methyltransferase [Acidimicrobiales bacterium]